MLILTFSRLLVGQWRRRLRWLDFAQLQGRGLGLVAKLKVPGLQLGRVRVPRRLQLPRKSLILWPGWLGIIDHITGNENNWSTANQLVESSWPINERGSIGINGLSLFRVQLLKQTQFGQRLCLQKREELKFRSKLRFLSLCQLYI